MIEPLFLHTPGAGKPGHAGARFALYHPAQRPHGQPPLACVLYLHPFAEELNKTRRMAALQAQAFAARGLAVLQLDLLGCGDSSGHFEDARWQAWMDDAVMGVHWLRTRAHSEHALPPPPMWLWGARTGALLAHDLLSQRRAEIGPCHLLLWQPMLRGAQQLQQLLRVAQVSGTMGGAPAATASNQAAPTPQARLAQGHSVDVAGYRLSAELAADLEARSLEPPPEAVGHRPTLLWLECSPMAAPSLRPASLGVLDAWREAGWAVHAQAVEGPQFWQTVEMEDAPQLLEHTTRACMEHSVALAGVQASGPLQPQPPWPVQQTEPHSEQAITFPCEGHTLVGVLHHPIGSAPRSGVGLVVVVGGPQTRVGSHRLFVRLARACAAQGITVLRFDLRGMGDSVCTATGLPLQHRPQPFEQAGPDLAAAVQALQEQAPHVRQVALWGLCDGASAALLQVLWPKGPAVHELHLVNPWVRSPESLARTHLRHHYLQRLQQREFWTRLARGAWGLSHLKGLWATVRTAQQRPTRGGQAFQDRMALGLQRFGGPVHITLSGQDHTAREFELQSRRTPAWREAMKQAHVQVHHHPQADHTFSEPALAQELIDRTVQALLPKPGEKPAALPLFGQARCVASLPPDALELMEQAGQHSVFAHPGWWELFERTVVQAQQGRSHYAYSSRYGHVQAVLPLMHLPESGGGWRAWARRQWHGPTWQAMSNYYSGLYAPVLNPGAGAEELASLMRQVVAELPRRSRVLLGPLDEGQLPPLEAALRATGRQPRRVQAFVNWYESVCPGEQGFEDYWAQRPSNLRNTVRRAAKKFKAQGGTLEITDGRDAHALSRAQRAYEQVYARSWKPQESLVQFMPQFIRLAAQQGWLRLGVAWLQGQPVAAHLWLVSGPPLARRAEIFKLAYDEAAKPWSAGSLLGHHLMAHVVVVDGVREVDYLSGDDSYKALWMTQRRIRWQLEA